MKLAKKEIYKLVSLIYLFGSLLFFFGCESDDPVEPLNLYILDKLKNLPGVQVLPIQPNYGYSKAFQIDLWQPLDHDNPNGAGFTQRIYLHHAGENLPMVFSPSGYGATATFFQEAASILSANHIAVVHRYFENSRPANLEWKYLDIKQAANDHHKIVQLFKTIYKNKWVSSGASKGGMTCLFHKRFFPDDIDVVLAYVAPIEFGLNDKRFVDFFKTIGTQEDKTKIVNFQRMILEKRAQLVPKMVEWFQINNLQFTGDADALFEGRVTSYDWNFWQYHDVTSAQIPPATASLNEMINHFASASKLDRSSVSGYEYFLPYYVQAYTQLGTPGNDLSAIADLLKYKYGDDSGFMNSFSPPLVFDPSVMIDINNWLVTKGNNIIYLYGAIDPWTGGAIQLTGATNALKIVQPGGDHRIRISSLNEYELVISTMEKWLGFSIPRRLGKYGKDIYFDDKNTLDKKLRF